MTNFANMTKSELIEMLQNQTSSNGRKQQVLDLLKKGYDSIEAIAEQLNITTKNVSSQLTYLRKDGYNIVTLNIRGESILTVLDDETVDFIMSKQPAKTND